MEARLNRIERWNRILVAGLALALLPWVVAAAEKIPDLLEAKNAKFQAAQAASFDLVDEAGNKAGGLAGKKDASSLTIKDSSGTIRLLLGIYKGNPSLLFADKGGNIVASYAEKDGNFEVVK